MTAPDVVPRVATRHRHPTNLLNSAQSEQVYVATNGTKNPGRNALHGIVREAEVGARAQQTYKQHVDVEVLSHPIGECEQDRHNSQARLEGSGKLGNTSTR